MEFPRIVMKEGRRLTDAQVKDLVKRMFAMRAREEWEEKNRIREKARRRHSRRHPSRL